MKLVTTNQMRALEQDAVDAGASWAGLMEQAGWGVAQEAMQLLHRRHLRRVLVLIGPGNNGGDGLVAARHLADADAAVTLYVWRRKLTEDDANWRRCRERQIPTVRAEDDQDRQQLQTLLTDADLVIDALLGVGLSRPIEGLLADIITTVNAAARPTRQVLAIDVPTGLDSENGSLHDVAIRADLTVATGALKPGLLLWPGRGYSGDLRLAEIGLTDRQMEKIMSEQIDATTARTLLPARPADSHKGTFGKVMVVAGSLLYPGAASLATAAALRVGAGLVTLATGRSALAGPGRLAEITLRPLPEAEPGAIGSIAADELLKNLDGYNALLVGPGLGHEPPVREFLERLLGINQPRHRLGIGFRNALNAESPKDETPHPLPPTVLDADALNILSEIDNWWEHLPAGHAVLTPHPKEIQRLLKLDAIPSDPLTTASDAATRWQQIVVLKGATTVIASPQGKTMLHDGGNPALATAGTGDVLAGAIAGLIAQGLAPLEAATLGVYLHGTAGRLVRQDLGDAGAIASDLLPRLPLAIKATKA